VGSEFGNGERGQRRFVSACAYLANCPQRSYSWHGALPQGVEDIPCPVSFPLCSDVSLFALSALAHGTDGGGSLGLRAHVGRTLQLRPGVHTLGPKLDRCGVGAAVWRGCKRLERPPDAKAIQRTNSLIVATPCHANAKAESERHPVPRLGGCRCILR